MSDLVEKHYRFLTSHADFHGPLKRELVACGVEVCNVKLSETIINPESVIGYMVWFYDCLRFPLQVWRLRKQLKKYGIPLIAWNRDAPHYLNRKPWRLDLLNRFRLLDIYASHTLIDHKRHFADSTMYFPNAADTTNYAIGGEDVLDRLRDPSNYLWDVSFFGGMNGARYKEDQARADFFAALGAALSVRRINFRFQEAEGMSIAEQVQFIQRSRINLNFGARCEYLAPVASGLPERCYGIPAVGGFLLCDQRTHAKDDFSLGINWAEFDGVDECVQQIEHWLADFSAARDLAESCHAHVLKNHTYRQRAETLLNALHAWHAGQRGRLA